MDSDLVKKFLYEYDTDRVLEEIDKIEDEETLYDYISQYDWDDGFEIPYKVLRHKCCTLSIALMMFYDGEGYLLFDDELEHGSEEYKFARKLNDMIISGTFRKGNTKYNIPLSKVQKYKYRKSGAAEIFLNDI